MPRRYALKTDLDQAAPETMLSEEEWNNPIVRGHVEDSRAEDVTNVWLVADYDDGETFWTEVEA